MANELSPLPNFLNTRFAIILMLLVGVAFSCLYFFTLILHFDNLQILNKAILYVDEGQWTHYGNAGSGVGFVPGTLMTALSAVPMKIWFSPYSAMAIVGLFHLAALWLLGGVAKNLNLAAPWVLVMIFFWLNPWRVEQAELYNPGYLFVFSALHLSTALAMNERRFGMTFCHALGIGLCAQFHFSALILVFSSLLMWRARMIRPHWGAFLAAVFVCTLTLIPYLQSYLHDRSLHLELARSSEAFFGRNLVLIYPVLKAVLYFLRYGSTYFGSHIFDKVQFEWLGETAMRPFLETAYHLLIALIGAVTLYFSFQAQREIIALRGRHLFRPESSRLSATFDDRFLLYGFYLFIGMLVASALSPVEFNHWHLILCFPYISLFMARWFARQSWPTKIKNPVVIGLLLFFCVHDLLAGLGSRSHSYKNNFGRDFANYYHDLKKSKGRP